MRITGAVALNGQVYRAGREAELEAAAKEAGVDLADARFAGAIEGASGGQSYADMTKDELQALADERGVTVQGTGKDGGVLKGDLVKALGG